MGCTQRHCKSLNCCLNIGKKNLHTHTLFFPFPWWFVCLFVCFDTVWWSSCSWHWSSRPHLPHHAQLPLIPQAFLLILVSLSWGSCFWRYYVRAGLPNWNTFTLVYFDPEYPKFLHDSLGYTLTSHSFSWYPAQKLWECRSYSSQHLLPSFL